MSHVVDYAAFMQITVGWPWPLVGVMVMGSTCCVRVPDYDYDYKLANRQQDTGIGEHGTLKLITM